MWNLRDPGLIVVIFDLKLDGPNLNNLEFEGLCRSEAFRMAPMSNMRVFCQNVSQSVDPTADGRLGVGGGRREEGPQLFKDVVPTSPLRITEKSNISPAMQPLGLWLAASGFDWEEFSVSDPGLGWARAGWETDLLIRVNREIYYWWNWILICFNIIVVMKW